MDKVYLILSINHVPTLDEFLEALGLNKSGFGARLYIDVYNTLFVSSINLKDEYEKYYCVEYSTLRCYLEMAHEIYFSPEELEKKFILKIKPTWGVVDQAYEGNSLDAVLNCIKKLEAAHED